MDGSTLTLRRARADSTGVYGELRDEDGNLIAVTLEHAYPVGILGWAAKVPAGVYTCVQGKHQLSAGAPFTTYEITGVPGHTGILFHCGNLDQDSEGCVLLGTSFGENCILESRIAFAKFMAMEGELQEFELMVSDP